MIVTSQSNELLLRTGKNESLEKYFNDIFKRLPKNTQRAFNSTYRSYAFFCSVNNLISFSETMSVTEESVKKYVTSMCESQLSFKTVKTRISILSKLIALAELKNPIKESEYLKDFIRLELQEFDIYNRAKQAPALRLEDLEKINSTVIPENLLDIRDLALVNVMFDGLLRADDVARVQIKHIDFKQNRLLVEKSKNDQAGAGSYRYISDISLSYISDYLTEANEGKLEGDPRSIRKGILFRATSPKGTSLRDYDESVTRTGLMTKLNYTTIYRAIKRIAQKAELDFDISGHSMRVGGAVSLAEDGQSIVDIKNAGGWKTDTQPARYIEQARIENGMSVLARKNGR